jgi:hypothetical protein
MIGGGQIGALHRELCKIRRDELRADDRNLAFPAMAGFVRSDP